MIDEKLLCSYIYNNEIDEIVNYTINNDDNLKIIDWLIAFIKKTEIPFERNTVAIVLSDLHVDRAVPVIMNLIDEYCSTNNYATLIYALSDLNINGYVSKLIELMNSGNYEARLNLYWLLKNNITNFNSDEKKEIQQKFNEYVIDYDERIAMMNDILKLFEN